MNDMRKLFVILLGLISSIGLSAENYPYRSDYLWDF